MESPLASHNTPEGDSPVPSGSEQLSDPSERLLRHIRRAWYDNGVASSQNFEPMPKDRSHLSVERGSMIEAEAAHKRWIGWGRDSVAVFGVVVGSYSELGAPSFHVPIHHKEEKNPEHALVRYPEKRSQAARLAKAIKGKAEKVFEPQS
jgi:hypothetical protein